MTDNLISLLFTKCIHIFTWLSGGVGALYFWLAQAPCHLFQALVAYN
jgi:hypothetical protein